MERDVRRNKIMSRGTDRMALITGRIQSMDSGQLSKSCSLSTPTGHDLPTAQHTRSSSEPMAPNDEPFFQYYHHGEDDLHGTPRLGTPKLDNKKVSKGFPDLKKIEEREVATKSSTPAFHTEAQSSVVNARVLKTSDDTPFGNFLVSITPKEINSSIISSENTRVICSAIIAVLVVMSHVNLPHKVVKSKSLIAYRPLYVVLLTDVLVVAARLALYTQIKEEEEKEPKYEDDGLNWGGAVKLLEFGLVLHQTLRAVFIDCSFYFVIVICGLSLL
ncbi:hypothetical protein ACJIZ3_025495 [Penstemon smallii]|uniref:Uncharacterized protein n=1 Tax=Penstemon smallii TaxID=265156 RepID=A0ABD3TUT3_9LAMI